MDNLADQVTKTLRAQGGRMTAQRQRILDALESIGGHPTAEEIYQHVREVEPNLNLSTVYRNLHWLETHGFVNPRQFGEERSQRFDPAHAGDHNHFRCLHCDEIIEFTAVELDSIKASFSALSGAKVTGATLVLYGLCPTCRARAT